MDINKLTSAVWVASEVVQALSACIRNDEYSEYWFIKARAYSDKLHSLLNDILP